MFLYTHYCRCGEGDIKLGRIAQLGEHLPYKQGVIGSSPIVPTKFTDVLSIRTQHINYGPVVQLVRMPACHAGGRGFEPLLGRQTRSVKWEVRG